MGECASEQLGKRVWSDGPRAQCRRRRASARARGLEGSAQLGPAVAAYVEGCAQVQVARGVAHTAARGGFARSGDAENGEAEEEEEERREERLRRVTRARECRS